jgi:uncharacterized protein (TIGR03118 family)
MAGFHRVEEASAVRTVLARGSRLAVVLAIAGMGVAGKAVAASDQYLVHPMVSSNAAIPADRVDANLKNAWGLVASPTSPWWTSNQATNTSTLYPATGAANPLVVGVTGGPTGIVFGGAPAVFPITGGNANFIFDTLSGTIQAWRAGTQAEVRYTAADGAAYTGLATAGTGAASQLFAADFRNGKIDVLDNAFALAGTPGGFTDPSLPAGYAPFNAQTIGSRVFVTYAKPDPATGRSTPGVGLGYVDAYDTSGRLLGRVASTGPLNAPWGVAQAPAGFGAFAGDLLVGNFGDGRIDAYKETAANTWAPDGTLKGLDGNPLVIDGLWALEFGFGAANNGPTTTLFYTAGPAGETQGAFGRIQANPLGVSGTVPATLALTLGGATSFGSFTPGLAMDYLASSSADVLSTAGNATLAVSDPDATNPGHLVNGTTVLPQALQADATSAAGTGGAFAPVGSATAPTTLLTYTGPVSHDPATINFKQPIAATDPLRTGTYTKTLTFTLSTTQP